MLRRVSRTVRVRARARGRSRARGRARGRIRIRVSVEVRVRVRLGVAATCGKQVERREEGSVDDGERYRLEQVVSKQVGE